MSEDLVLIEHRDSVAIITLNDPSRMNPISDGMRNGLLNILSDVSADNSVRAIVLTGAGGQFSAGADVRQMGKTDGPDSARSKRRLKLLQDVVRFIAAGPKPVVSAVEGVAFGAALSMVAASDYVIAGKKARFGAAFGRIGLAPDCGIMWSMPQRIGMVKTKDLIFTGAQVKADEALLIGLVEEVVDEGAALDRALEKANEYKNVAPLSIAATKEAAAQLPDDLNAALNIEIFQQPLLSSTQDHAEARTAFMEKRSPTFIGR